MLMQIKTISLPFYRLTLKHLLPHGDDGHGLLLRGYGHDYDLHDYAHVHLERQRV